LTIFLFVYFLPEFVKGVKNPKLVSFHYPGAKASGNGSHQIIVSIAARLRHRAPSL
jgi:hypothetical protein